MPTIEKNRLNRVIDANVNRAKEGLRVCEDICRFAWDRPHETKKWKTLRHDFTEVVSPYLNVESLRSRNIEGDVGKASSRLELKRQNVEDIFFANSQRVKESIRVLEEFSKLKSPKRAERLKNLRYKVYALEKGIIK